MSQPVTIVGSYLSPYVRKVLVFLHEKSIPYKIDPIVPFFGNDEFSRLSPLRRIPVLIDDQVSISDSSVICQYLEDRHPEPPLYPDGIVDRARARWLEEFADTRMGEVIIWRLFNQVAIGPGVWGERPNAEIIERARTQEIPTILDYLEAQVPEAGFLFGRLSIADIAIGCFFRNAAFARFEIDRTRWPRTAAFVERVLQRDSFTRLAPFEQRLLRTPIQQHRPVLGELGAPLLEASYGTETPRRGIMHI